MSSKKHGSNVPLIQQRVVNISIRQDLLPWWDEKVEPLIEQMGGSRSAFVMAAVREFVENHGG